MVRGFIISILLITFFLMNACSSGSSSGGSSSLGSTNTSTYSPKDMEGSWNYTQNSPGRTSCSGVLTFSGTGRLTGFTNSCCPGGQKVDAEFWIFSDGYVKGRNYAWCNQGATDQNPMLKYSMNFKKNSYKNEISGIVDLHFTDPDYIRWDITMTRQVPVPPPPPPDPDPNTQPNLKKSLKSGAGPGSPAKR
jgi:hypothetical protein